MTCYSWAPSRGDHLFTCGAIYPPPHSTERSVKSLQFSFLRILLGRNWQCLRLCGGIRKT